MYEIGIRIDRGRYVKATESKLKQAQEQVENHEGVLAKCLTREEMLSFLEELERNTRKPVQYHWLKGSVKQKKEQKGEVLRSLPGGSKIRMDKTALKYTFEDNMEYEWEITQYYAPETEYAKIYKGVTIYVAKTKERVD